MMKIINRFTGALLACTVFCGVGHASGDDNNINKEMLESSVRNYQSAILYCIRTGDGHSVDKEAKTKKEVTLSEERTFKLRIESLIHQNKIQSAYEIPELCQKRFETDQSYKNGYGVYTNCSFFDRSEHLKIMIHSLEDYVTAQIKSRYETFIKTNQFSSALQIAEAYSSKNSSQAGTWLSEIKTLATKEVEYHAKASVRLAATEDLSMEEEKKALAIISSFPTSHSLRAHLQKCFDDMKQTTKPPTASEDAKIAIFHEIMGMN